MAENVALFHRRHDAVEQMQVRAADRAGRHLDDGIATILNFGIRHGLAADVVLAVPGQRFHRSLSPGQDLLIHKRPETLRFPNDGKTYPMRGTRSSTAG